MEITQDKLMQKLGEITLRNMVLTEELNKAIEIIRGLEAKLNATPIEDVEFEKNGLALCTE